MIIATYRSRDIGYGIEMGQVYWPGGAPDWIGKRPYQQVGPFGQDVYLFDDEITELDLRG